MDTLERLAGMLDAPAAREIERGRDRLREVRLRAGRPVQLIDGGANALVGGPIDPERLKRVLAALADYSVYAREAELGQGFLTLLDGCRVGVCGRMAMAESGARLTAVGSICVRVARAVPGCADGLMPHILDGGRPCPTLIVSPPGLGKTTLLRDTARQLSDAGYCVAVADERHELAACLAGAPTLDVGPRTDVADGCPKVEAIEMLIRSMAPEVIITDEIGGPGDAAALAEARRCGACVIASAHASGFDALARRTDIKPALEAGVFERVALLGSPPGTLLEVRAPARTAEGRLLWKCA